MPLRPLIGMATCLLGICGGLALADEPTKPTASATEKDPAKPAAGHSVHGEAFNDGPRQAGGLIPGMGQVDFPITASSPEVKAMFLQGVAQIHSFYYYEAERSFRRASQIEPNNPMPYWGMAMANVVNPKRAKGFLKEARAKLAEAKPSRREVLYIEALEAFFKEAGDDKGRRKGWLEGLESIVQEFPNDLDAQSWLAMATWQASTQDGIGSRQAVDMLIDQVLAANPLHPGAQHYRIHLWDHQKVARAERAAALYARSAPGIAHAWHMPGHTYTELKRYAEAAYQQEGSARVDHAAMLRDRTMPFEIHNYAHNNQWLSTSLSYVGRARDAIAVARDLVEQPRDPQKNGPNDGGSAQRSGRLRWAEVLAKYELWDDLIAATKSKALDWADSEPEKSLKPYYLGLAYAAKGDQAALAEQIAALKANAKPAEAGKDKPAAPAADRGSVYLAELEGYRLLAESEFGRAFESFAKATSMRPESLARAHLAARNYGLAESAARDAVTKSERQVPALAACVEILHAVGKEEAARECYKNLAPLAREADADTPVMRRLAPLVARWTSEPTWSDGKPSDEAAVNRVDLTTLGSLTYQPSPALPLAGTDTDGKPWDLAEHRGRNVLVLFYLGGKCTHCMQQLEEFGKAFETLRAAGTDVIGISTDDLAGTRLLKAPAEAAIFPMPLLPNADLKLFHTYRAFDDFEGQPLHGLYLIDARGLVRFQRISADPFLDVDFIKAESSRINALNR